MKDLWYGDMRDLVKWGVLLHLAGEFGAGRILQVPYLRESTWGGLELDGQQIPIPDAVIRHFRNVRNITTLADDPRIELITAHFDDRGRYTRLIMDSIADRPVGESCIVFLDPDTGLQPTRPKLEHVLETELRDIWEAMQPGDVLVFYQNQTNRSGEPWIEAKRKQFEDALGLVRGAAKVAQGRSIARDVAFFYCGRR